MRGLLLGFLLVFTSESWADRHGPEPLLQGIGNRGANPDKPYVTAGDRAYLIGTQDGGFADLGWHVPGEMAGLWLHPIKLIDGFWATVEDSATGRAVPLSRNAYAFLRDACRGAIEQGRLRPEIDDADQLAQILWGSVHGLISLRIAKRHNDWVPWRDLRSTARAAMQIHLRGILRDPAAADGRP